MALKPKRTRSYYFLLTGVLGLIIVASFIAYQLYSAFTRTQISERQQLNITPLPGAIEPKVIDNLSSRRKFVQEEFSQLVLNRVIEAPAATSAGGSLGP